MAMITFFFAPKKSNTISRLLRLLHGPPRYRRCRGCLYKLTRRLSRERRNQCDDARLVRTEGDAASNRPARAAGMRRDLDPTGNAGPQVNGLGPRFKGQHDDDTPALLAA